MMDAILSEFEGNDNDCVGRNHTGCRSCKLERRCSSSGEKGFQDRMTDGEDI